MSKVLNQHTSNNFFQIGVSDNEFKGDLHL